MHMRICLASDAFCSCGKKTCDLRQKCLFNAFSLPCLNAACMAFKNTTDWYVEFHRLLKVMHFSLGFGKAKMEVKLISVKGALLKCHKITLEFFAEK